MEMLRCNKSRVGWGYVKPTRHANDDSQVRPGIGRAADADPHFFRSKYFSSGGAWPFLAGHKVPSSLT
jgi:hypothetical protein